MKGQKAQPKAHFSVKYKHPNFPDEVWAADWGLACKGQWARSWRKKESSRWNLEAGIDEPAHKAILEKFGLTDFKQNFPISTIIRLSPRKLDQARTYRKEIQITTS